MKSVHEHAQVLWNYLVLGQERQRADILLVLGSNSLRIADCAAELYKAGYAPLIVVAGGRGPKTRFIRTEAKVFAQRMRACGVPKSALIIETASSNTAENILFVKQLLTRQGIAPRSVLLVQKPHMERRAYATLRALWPEVKGTVTSPLSTYSDYEQSEKGRDKLIHTLVGDIERLIEYPKRGFFSTEPIPPIVRGAYEALISCGYTDYRL